MSDCYEHDHDHFEMLEDTGDEFLMWQGLVGPHFSPHVDEYGNLSWTNNGQLLNPAPVNIAGKPGTGIEITGRVNSVEELPESAAQGQVWAVGIEEPYEAYCWLGEWFDLGLIFPTGPRGDTGPYFTPSVDSSGNLSWTNNGDLPNPDTVNIKGPPGEDAVSPSVTIEPITGGYRITITDAEHPTGQQFDVMDGEDGDDGISPGVSISSIQGGHRVTITDASHPGGQSVDIMDGIDGDDGDNGATFTPSVAANGDISWTNDKSLPNPQTVNIKGPQGEGVPPGGTAGQVLRKTASGTEWHSPDAEDAAYDGTGTYTAGTVGAGIKANAASIASLIQESAFEIEVEDGEYVLYWYGAAGECPYTVEYENGEYVLYFNYSTT